MVEFPLLRQFRAQRGVLHLLIVLFASGHVGTTARTCVLEGCRGSLIALLVIGSAGIAASLTISILLFINVKILAKWEWAIDLLLIPVWAAAVAMTTIVTEQLISFPTSTFAPALIAFAWLGITLMLLAAAIALIGWDGPFGLCLPFDMHGIPWRSADPDSPQGRTINDEPAQNEPVNRTEAPETTYMPHSESAGLSREFVV